MLLLAVLSGNMWLMLAWNLLSILCHFPFIVTAVDLHCSLPNCVKCVGKFCVVFDAFNVTIMVFVIIISGLTVSMMFDVYSADVIVPSLLYHLVALSEAFCTREHSGSTNLHQGQYLTGDSFTQGNILFPGLTSKCVPRSSMMAPMDRTHTTSY